MYEIIWNMDTNEFHDIVLRFEFGFSNEYWYEVYKNRLVSAKDWAFSNFELLEKTCKYNIKDIYKQFYDFESCIAIKLSETITKTREEAIIFALLQYATENRPIISATFTECENQLILRSSRSSNYNPETERIKSIQGRKVSALSSLLAFYMQNSQTNEECYDALHKTFIDYITNEIRLNKYSDYDIYEIDKLDKLPNRYESNYVIHYLKILIAHKDFATANEIFDKYPVKPRNKKETADYDRIKIKLGKQE